MATSYYSGQGIVYLADRDANGQPMGFVDIGNVPKLELSVEITKFEHKESRTGSRAVDLSIIQEKKGTFAMTMEQLGLENLVTAFWGTGTTRTSGSVADGAGTSIQVKAYKGKRCAVPGYAGLSSVVVKFGPAHAGATTAVLGTDYTLDAANGVIIPTVLGAIDDEDIMWVSFSYAAQTMVDAFTQTSMEKYLRFEGLNTVDGKAVIVDIFKASLDPLSGYGLINEELGSVEITGSVLSDDLQTTGSKFYRQINVT